MKPPVEIDIAPPEGMNEAEQARFEQALDNARVALSDSVRQEVEAFIAAMVKRRFNEVFMLGLACGVALACIVVIIGHWAATS